MFGVVLWRDRSDCKAVIWCEDQGDLAIYRQSNPEEQVDMNVGDWVEFDLESRQNQRLVCNPRLVNQTGCPKVGDLLIEAQKRQDTDAEMRQQRVKIEPKRSAQILAFDNSSHLKGTRGPDQGMLRFGNRP